MGSIDGYVFTTYQRVYERNRRKGVLRLRLGLGGQCGHVDDYIKTTRFIEYMLTYVVCKMA